jgi:hypothetical protein
MVKASSGQEEKSGIRLTDKRRRLQSRCSLTAVKARLVPAIHESMPGLVAWMPRDKRGHGRRSFE